MTAEDVALLALARLAEAGASVPPTRSLMYRRIHQRQHELFARAAQVDDDYFGVCITGQLDAGAADLRAAKPPIAGVEKITRVEVADPGQGRHAPRTKIHLVRLDDSERAAYPPRATLRDGVLRGVDDDLADVASVRVHYSRLPAPIGPADAEAAIELPEPHSELLVVDLARHLLKRHAPANPAAAELAAEEEALLAAFDAHVAGYATQESRF